MPKDKKDKHKGKAQKHYEDVAEEAVLVAVVEGDVELGPDGADVASVEVEEEITLPGVFTPQLEGDYCAAFSDEILNAEFIQRAFLAQLPPGDLLPHSGRVRLTETGLDFEGLTVVPFADMVSLHAHVDRVYHRYYAGLAALGGRGAGHHLTGAEPFVLTFRQGERERSLYTLLDWPFFLALSKDKNWRKAVGGVLPAKEKKK
jgi:hypothetical protein